MILNCDLGERGLAHPIDDQIIEHVEMVNLACGGHAGSKQSVQYYEDLAKRLGKTLSAHFSYDDISNFGRRELGVSFSELLPSLRQQLDCFKNTPKWCKPHGALYHRVHQDIQMARPFLEWLKKEGFDGVVGMPNSLWLQEAKALGLETRCEVFAERKYILQEGGPTLSSRECSWASISSLTEAFNQSKLILEQNKIEVVTRWSQTEILEQAIVPICGDTLCIHSDSAIALDLVQKLSGQ